MKPTKNQCFVVYTIGRCYQEFNRRFSDKPLEISMSKSAFVELCRKAGIVQKKERALYMNIEVLEKKKLVSYQNKSLKLTLRGNRLYKKIEAGLLPYINVTNVIGPKSLQLFTKKARAILKY